ncbi:O-methyltransferase [Marinitenerispora sediminis]|uniref:O-methyltransferase n=1 Tax=Marinitenerispora sediminis TaxID=1931232 RepID=UPI0035A8BC38
MCDGRDRRSSPSHAPGEAVIASRDDTLAYIEQYAAEDDPLASARRVGLRADSRPVSPASGAALRFLAAAIAARAVVEIGTGCGSSGIWLLRGMRPDGILTSVDVEPEYQEHARDAYQSAGFAANRARLIHGRALDVLPRLTDGAYDMVFIDAAKGEYPDYLQESLRLLRRGGIVVFNNALEAHPHSDGPLALSDPDSAAIREAGRLVREDDRLTPLLLPVGDGLLAAIRSDEAR